MTPFDTVRAAAFIDRRWTDVVLPLLFEYIKIPNATPHYYTTPEHPKLALEVAHKYAAWASEQLDSHKIPSVTQVFEAEGRTPLIIIEVFATEGVEGTVFMYGHCDKQPPLTEKWRKGLHPYEPVFEDDKLYGRGAADDGYALPAAITAIQALHEQGVPHSRIVILIEAGEESGSPDLEYYITEQAELIGTPDLIICLDSGCGSYDRLWATTSLRGVISFRLRVDVLSEAVHSGSASGIVPASERIIKLLIGRIENVEDGFMPLLTLDEVPEERIKEAEYAAGIMGEVVYKEFPFVGDTGPVMEPEKDTLADVLLQGTWYPQMVQIAGSGIPETGTSGNVLRPYTEAEYSVRVPPTFDPKTALEILEHELTRDPPYGAKVTFTPGTHPSPGWNAPPLAVWLVGALNRASVEFFGEPVAYKGEGGTIPFMKLLGDNFPNAQFVITGVLGPGSNAHGPNEYLHIPTGKKVTAAVASIVASFVNRPK